MTAGGLVRINQPTRHDPRWQVRYRLSQPLGGAAWQGSAGTVYNI